MTDFDIEKVIDKINPKIYERGEDYYEEGRVNNLRLKANVLLADVIGTESYKVRIENEDGIIMSQCTCPFKDEEFCKHSVAVLLVWKHRDEDKESISEYVSEEERLDVLKKTISQKSKRELTNFILKHVPEEKTDLILAQRGLGNDKTKDLFLRSIKIKISGLFRRGRFVDYQSSFKIAQKTSEILQVIEKSTEDNPILGLELLWYLLKKSKNIFNDIDDSSGIFGDEIHFASKLIEDCLNKTKESKQKNEIILEIFREWFEDEYGYFDCLLDVLNNTKLSNQEIDILLPEVDKELRKTLEKLSHASDESNKFHHIFNLSQLLLLYAKLKIRSGKINEGLGRFKQHLYLTKNYDALGTLLLELKRFPEAEETFKEGLNKYPGRKERLYEGLISLYEQTNEKEKLSEVLSESFHYNPIKGVYDKLKNLNLADWNNVQKELFSFLRTPEHHHILIDIHLSENNAIEAFNVAKEYSDGPQTLVYIGDELKENYPEEAIWCYKQAVEDTVSKGSRYYWIALKHINEIREIYERTGKRNEFENYISNIKEKHKLKRTLIEKLSRSLNNLGIKI